MRRLREHGCLPGLRVLTALTGPCLPAGSGGRASASSSRLLRVSRVARMN